MANQSTSRLKGDDYQHLISWFYVLTLKMPDGKVREVRLEDDSSGSFDDVTVLQEDDSDYPDCFYQIKYHVDHSGQYSTDVLLDNTQGSSLLSKFWHTWNILRQQSRGKTIELCFLSNWTWDGQDQVRRCIDGEKNALKRKFFEASPRCGIGKIRELWRSELKASPDEFKVFARSLRFRLGFSSMSEIKERVIERMQHLGLKSDQSSLLIAVGIVREWIKSGMKSITLDVLEKALAKHNLYRLDDEKSVTVYLTTVKGQKFDIEPDYHLDWRDLFEEITGTNRRGHQLKNPSDWNQVLLPELYDLEDKISHKVGCRLIRARGLARLSAWFAFGHVFSGVARYIIELDQSGKLWRTDVQASPDFSVQSFIEETLNATGNTAALGISVTQSLDDDVRGYLSKRTDETAALLLLRPNCEFGSTCIRSAGDAVALAEGVKSHAQRFVRKTKATRLLLFYCGPLSGACFIGHRMNAVCQEIQIMEDMRPGYAPSFLLRYQ